LGANAFKEDSMSLTIAQKIYADKLFHEKEGLIEKRTHNRREIVKLKNILISEQSDRNCRQIKTSIEAGEELIKRQSTYINALSMRRMSELIKTEETTLKYYFLSANSPKCVIGFENKKAAYEKRRANGISL